VRFLSTNWLLDQPDTYIIQRRQDLPEEALLHPQKAGSIWVDTPVAMIVLSYGWISPKHPDPERFHLSRLLKYLKRYKIQMKSTEIFDCCTFWDYASLPQEPRSEVENVLFKRGLAIINLLYSAPKTLVLQLKEMPVIGTDVKLINYDLRGWCTFEEICSSVQKRSLLLVDLSRITESLDGNDDFHEITAHAVAGRRPPVHPDTMEQILKSKKFTNGADRDMVVSLYREFFREVCKSLSQLHFQKIGTGAGWGPKEAAQLADSLQEFRSCATLQLSGHPFEDAGVISIARALPNMPCLKKVDFDGCTFGTAGLRALREQFETLKMLDSISLPGELEETEEAEEVEELAKDLSRHGTRCLMHKPLKVIWAKCITPRGV